MNWQRAEGISGTHLQGYLQATYRDLVATFGEPTQEHDEKVTTEWRIRFEDGTLATIYDWRGSEWHIGGFGPEAVNLVRQTLEAADAPATATYF